MSEQTCPTCGGELIEVDGEMVCPLCDDVTIYSEDKET